MRSRSPLLSVAVIGTTKPCFSQQVFYEGRRLAGGIITTAKGLKPLKQCSQPGSLNPGAALESDGVVKRLNTRKHRHQEQANEADQGLDQKGKRSGSGFLTWPDANGAPPVYRVDLTRPVRNVEHGKAVENTSRLGRSKAGPPQGRPRGNGMERIEEAKADL